MDCLQTCSLIDISAVQPDLYQYFAV